MRAMRMRRHFLPTVMVCVVISCGGKSGERAPAATPPEPKAATPTAEDTPKAAKPESPPMESDELRVFFGREQGSQYFARFGGKEKPKAYFTPTRAEIEKLEAGLPDMLRDALKGQPAQSPPLWERVSKYRRQYLAYVDSSDKPWIWGNFMCVNAGRVGSDAWRKTIVDVDDGGDCFFNVEFSPETGKFRRFQINGDG